MQLSILVLELKFHESIMRKKTKRQLPLLKKLHENLQRGNQIKKVKIQIHQLVF